MRGLFARPTKGKALTHEVRSTGVCPTKTATYLSCTISLCFSILLLLELPALPVMFSVEIMSTISVVVGGGLPSFGVFMFQQSWESAFSIMEFCCLDEPKILCIQEDLHLGSLRGSR